jgi:hypothetical protein
MALAIRELGDRRYVGDAAKKIVHDRWHPDCEDCLMDDIVASGDAVGFEPDELDQAFYEGYEYCEDCFDRGTPERPALPGQPA